MNLPAQMDFKKTAQESIQKSLSMISLVFSVFKVKPTTKPIQSSQNCALKAPTGFVGHDQALWGSSWPEPYHGGLSPALPPHHVRLSDHVLDGLHSDTSLTCWLELRPGSSPGHCLIVWTHGWTRPPSPACPAHFT